VSGKEIFHYRNKNTRAAMSVAFSPDGSLFATGMGDGSVILWDLSRKGLVDGVPLKEQLDKSLEDLRSADAGKAYRSVWLLSSLKNEGVTLLKPFLKPAQHSSDEAISQYIRDLDNDDFDIREMASERLARLGPQAETLLRKALVSTESEEMRSRLKPLVKNLDQWIVKGPESLFVVRAIWVLQRIGTADAVAVLEDLAKGAQKARQTEEAQAALTILKKNKSK
jgi:WD40 repeat protein